MSTLLPLLLSALVSQATVQTSPHASTRLYVRTIPTGATVLIDGQPLGASDGLFLVPAGVHKLTVQMDGVDPKVRQIEVQEGRITRIEVELRPSGNGAAPANPGMEGHGTSSEGRGPARVGQGSALQVSGGLATPPGVGGAAFPVSPSETSAASPLGNQSVSPELKIVRLVGREKQSASPGSPNSPEQPLERDSEQGRERTPEQVLREALARPVTIDCIDAPLRDVLDLLAQQQRVAIVVNERRLADNGLGLDTPITLSVRECRLSTALDLMLRPHELTWHIRGELLEISTRDDVDQQMRSVVYDVSDLTRDPRGLQWLIERGIQPEFWSVHGGAGTIETDSADGSESLVISQSEPVHREIAALLDTLRRLKATESPTVTPLAVQAGYWDASNLAAATRKALDRRISVDFVDAPLRDVVDYFADQLEIPIHIDGKSLEQTGLSMESPVSLKLTELPLATVLNTLLKQLDLEYAVDHESLMIVSAEASPASIAIYPVEDLLTRGRTLADLIRLIERTVKDSTWEDMGGTGRIIGVEGTPHCIVVSQTTAGHRAVDSFLQQLRQRRAGR